MPGEKGKTSKKSPSKSPKKFSKMKVNKEVDLKRLNDISDDYMSKTNAFNDINQVELKLVELTEQLNKARRKSEKKAIEVLIDKYEVQQKKLLIKVAEKRLEKEKDENSNKLPEVYVEDDNNALVLMDNPKQVSEPTSSVITPPRPSKFIQQKQEK